MEKRKGTGELKKKGREARVGTEYRHWREKRGGNMRIGRTLGSDDLRKSSSKDLEIEQMEGRRRRGRKEDIKSKLKDSSRVFRTLTE